MKELGIKQRHVPGKTDQGTDIIMYVSEPVPGKIKFLLNGETIHVDEEILKQLIRELRPVQGCKHAGTL